MSAADPFSILNRNKNVQQQPREQVKVQRYWPGKAPKAIYAQKQTKQNQFNQENEFEFNEAEDKDLQDENIFSEEESQNEEDFNLIKQQNFLQNQQKFTIENIQKQKEIHQPFSEESQITKGPDLKVAVVKTREEKQNDDEDILDRRARIRAKMNQQQQQMEGGKEENEQGGQIEIRKRGIRQQQVEEDNNKEVVEEENNKEVEEDNDLEELIEESEYDETDFQTQEEQQNTQLHQMLKPVFVRKEQRETQERLKQEEELLKQEQQKIQERRKQDTKQMVFEAVRANVQNEEEDKLEEGYEMPDDDDTIDEVNQYELWKIRELKRLKRDREEELRLIKEKKEIERRRNLTDEQRKREDKILGSDHTLKPQRQQMKFLQKYYHKGAFYQDAYEILNRDYNLPVAEDKWDKSNLPKVLQQRRGNFGKKGQSKWTHLTAEDTTDFNPMYKKDEYIATKIMQKMGGYKGSDVLDRQQLKKIKM